MKVTVDIEAQDSSWGELYICTNSVWKDAILMLTDMTCLEPGVVKANSHCGNDRMGLQI